MINRIVLLSFLTILSFSGFSQTSFKVRVFDLENGDPLIGAKVALVGTKRGAVMNVDGIGLIENVPDGPQKFIISYLGYEQKEIEVTFPNNNMTTVYLDKSDKEIDVILIEATRSNRSVADLPTRTEVLTEEIDEAASMEPSKISHLITHSTGIQVQTTSATSGGAVVRIQGLNGRYTQMLKDGFPMFGGFSGSLDVLQIPPLDLRQVEYIKGSASTLYGGGAIGGLINLLSKKPTEDETLLHINLSHIGSKDFNAFVSRRFGKFGFTNLASLHMHSPYDADDDGYSDIADVSKFNFNPKLYFYPDAKSEIYLGANIMYEERMGGDMKLIDREAPNLTNYYYDKQRSKRYVTQFLADREISKKSKLTLKNSISLFDRFIQIRTNSVGSMTQFAGQQLNSFSEFNYNFNGEKHNLNLGLNGYTERFSETHVGVFPSRNQEYLTFGAYANHLWDINKKVAIETGFRGDFAQAKSKISQNEGEFFALPKFSALYKVSKQISLRIGGGMGYRMPTIFNEEAEPYGYQNVEAIDFANVSAERSYGGNFDFKFRSTFGSDNILLTFNQMFFYNLIDNPILLTSNFAGNLEFVNFGDNVNSRGFESQIKLTFWKFTWFFGYTYTDAFLNIGTAANGLTLTPQHSIKGDLLLVEENKWRIGWDYEYKSSQLLTSGLKSRELFTTGIVVERTIDNFVIFLNAENFTDTRQTKYESILSGPTNTPQFTDIYAPLDGFFFNAGLKIKL
ncbi:MAG: outer membrane receptor for ferrienterochelin and colicins [Arenicella sp.]|jgi:outer membrane receptor for ferrienterochelin and colicins